MINRFMQAVNTVILLFALIGGSVAAYQGYKIYKSVQSRIDQIDQWIDRFADRDRKWFSFESRLEQLEVSKQIRFENEEVTKAPKVRPSVIMYSLDGCGACEQWWKNKSTAWKDAGWAINRVKSQTQDPVPYWDVWDGEKWFRITGSLTLDSYKQAGGK